MILLDMKKPKRCDECKLRYCNFCKVTGEDVAKSMIRNEYPDFCPIKAEIETAIQIQENESLEDAINRTIEEKK